MVDDITSYIETNYAGNLNDAPIWDDTKQSGPMQEEQSGPMQEVRSEEQNLLKTLTKFINIFYTIKPDKIVEVKNYKNLFMFMSMYLVAYGGDGQDFYYQLGSRYVITYLIFCNITGPTLVFMLDVNFKLSEHWDGIVEFMRGTLNIVLNISDIVMNDDAFYSFLKTSIKSIEQKLGYKDYGKKSYGGGKDNTTHISKNITHYNTTSKSSDQYNNAIIKMSGGSCQNITYFNPLLSVKCLYEWSHDFSSGRAQKYVINDPDFYKNEGGIFEIVKKGWKDLIDNAEESITSNIFMDIDYSQNPLIPVNQNLLINGSADRAPVQDSNYTSKAWSNIRYNGSRYNSINIKTL
jgi:hypothetical protein